MTVAMVILLVVAVAVVGSIAAYTVRVVLADETEFRRRRHRARRDIAIGGVSHGKSPIGEASGAACAPSSESELETDGV